MQKRPCFGRGVLFFTKSTPQSIIAAHAGQCVIGSLNNEFITTPERRWLGELANCFPKILLEINSWVENAAIAAVSNDPENPQEKPGQGDLANLGV